MNKSAECMLSNEKNRVNISHKVPNTRKVFFIPSVLLEEKNASKFNLCLNKFFHPGQEKDAMFMTTDGGHFMEVLAFTEPYRSWFIGNSVCSDGSIYITVPIDGTFLALHQFRKHCMRRALALDSLPELKKQELQVLASTECLQNLNCISDVRMVSGTFYYKYNAEKAIAWLALKTRHVARILKEAGIHCGNSAVSQNYVQSEIKDDNTNEMDVMRVACEIVSGYIDQELAVELNNYLEIPKETCLNKVKRKSHNCLTSDDPKKFKKGYIDENDELTETSTGNCKPSERILSTKEKSLAKSAKGTKSITSFFKK